MVRHLSRIPLGIACALLAGCAQPLNAPTPSPRAHATPDRATQQVSQVIGPGGITQNVGGVSQSVGSPFGPGFPFSWGSGAGGNSTTTTVTGPGSVASVTTVTSGGGGQAAYSSTVSGNREDIRASYNVYGPRTLEVSNLSGNIVIVRGPGNRLSFEAIKESGAGPAELGKATIAVSTAGPFSIVSNYLDPNARLNINYLIRVPYNMSIGRVTTGSGTVSINL
ncbi:hypothetical protein J7643_19840 [bacterium]|nr:hypothetical protein [bacterium]